MSATMTDSNGQPFTVNDAAAWHAWLDKNSDFYGHGTVAYAARWMALLEANADVSDIDSTLAKRAEDLSRQADTEGITVHMHAAAAAGIARFWTHGDAFRRWFNSANQLSTEGDCANESGGIVNPSVVHVYIQENDSESPVESESEGHPVGAGDGST